MGLHSRVGRILLVIGLLVAVQAAGRVTGTTQSRSGSGATVDPSLIQALRYRMIGPHRGGRVTAVTGVPSERGTFYMGSSGGGVWKTVDYGEVWENLSDKYFASASIGAIAVSVSDPKVVYAGTGSACLRGNIQPGLGLYRSIDGGATWQIGGLEEGGQIARIQIDPRDPNLVYVAVQGHAFGPNATRGVFRSKDGGKNWEKVLFVNDKTGASELAMDPRDPKVLYATMWTGEVKPWGLPSTSIDGGVFKTIDGGDHWTKLSGGLPQGAVGRIGVAVSPADANRVWVLVGDVPEGGVFRSDDAGKTFKLINGDRNLTGRSSYYAHIFADPKDVNVVYSANRDFYKSTDGGVTFKPLQTPHGDDHALWIDPNDTRVMILGNDGGATISVTGGRSWSSQLNQPTGEMYRVTVDNQVPYRVLGSQQDQYDALSLPSRPANFGERLQLQHWLAVGGYEGAAVVVDPRDPNIVYASGPGGRLTRYDHTVPRIRTINVTAGGRGGYRFAGTPPIVISPLDPDSLYNASHVVHRSTDGGQTFTVISPDLTGGSASRQAVGSSGSGEELGGWPTITAFETSRKEKGVLWAGTDDGIVQLSCDNGAKWTNVTPKDMPRFGLVNTIETSPHDAGRVFLAVTAYRTDDYRPYIYRTDDYGRTWTLVSNGSGIPANHFIRVVREDPIRKGLIYAGGEFGMYVSFDDGQQWQSLQLDLPVTPVTDLAVSQGDLVLSTNGRSFWILDDITPLRELAAQTSSTVPHLFTPRDTYRIRTSADEADDAYVFGACCVANARDLFSGARIERHQLGEDPPEGAIIHASFPQVPTEPVTLSVLGGGDRIVRTIFDTGRNPGGGPQIVAGLNRFNWDLRADSLGTGRQGGAPGPTVVPGRYQVRLTVGSRTETVPLTVLMDPRLARVRVTTQDLQKKYDLMAQIKDAVAEIQRAAATIRERRARLTQSSQAAGSTQADQAAALTTLERELVGAGEGGRGGRGGGGAAGGGRGGAQPLLTEFTSLYNFVADSEDKPTAAASARWNELKKSLDEKRARVNAQTSSKE